MYCCCCCCRGSRCRCRRRRRYWVSIRWWWCHSYCIRCSGMFGVCHILVQFLAEFLAVVVVVVGIGEMMMTDPIVRIFPIVLLCSPIVECSLSDPTRCFGCFASWHDAPPDAVDVPAVAASVEVEAEASRREYCTMIRIQITTQRGLSAVSYSSWRD